MISTLSKFDVLVVKFPFASSLKYKARPAVLISSEEYNSNSRNTSIIMAISSQIETKLDLEPMIQDWHSAGLLKKSILKASVATIENDYIITRLGTLSKKDQMELKQLIEKIC
ncbi:MAG: type II toxin-antitoxin system PemK/MazF family toxin [Campylobacterota bacterium]|nr:type II toxin-antitoxin system PemK/MazF family toxin [Campylobacterota bacterium]